MGMLLNRDRKVYKDRVPPEPKEKTAEKEKPKRQSAK